MTDKILAQAGEPKKKLAVEKKMSLFGQSIPFVQAFPMIAALNTTVWVRPYGKMEENPQQRHFRLKNPPAEHIHCPKTGCTNGGWPIGDIIRDMIAKRETRRRVEGKCSGRHWVIDSKYRECVTHFTADIELTYKPETNKDTAIVVSR